MPGTQEVNRRRLRREFWIHVSSVHAFRNYVNAAFKEFLRTSCGSSGGGLCAAVTLMARDRKTPPLIFQMPLYACLDDRHLTPSSHQMAAREMIWGRPLSLRGWQAYLGEDQQDNISAYAAPARAEDLSGLPPAYMMVGELDLLLDENITYAMRLMQAGVPTELHVYPGAFHGFEGMVKHASVSIRAVNESTEALKRGLRDQ